MVLLSQIYFSCTLFTLSLHLTLYIRGQDIKGRACALHWLGELYIYIIKGKYIRIGASGWEIKKTERDKTADAMAAACHQRFRPFFCIFLFIYPHPPQCHPITHCRFRPEGFKNNSVNCILVGTSWECTLPQYCSTKRKSVRIPSINIYAIIGRIKEKRKKFFFNCVENNFGFFENGTIWFAFLLLIIIWIVTHLKQLIVTAR